MPQGFASDVPVSIIFEENVYCGDDASTFFTVLWINRWCCSAWRVQVGL